MNENITILEGGIAQSFGNVSKLRTSNGSSNDYWVPEDDVKTESKYIRKNGLYYTREYAPTQKEKKKGHRENVYGYHTVTVSVINKTSGKKKKVDPSTGEEYDVPYTVDVDDEGNITEKELPTEIRITKNPKKLKYKENDKIDISGIVVHAYYADGSDWGKVPFGELEYEPETAELGQGETYTDGDGVTAIRVDYILQEVVPSTATHEHEYAAVGNVVLGRNESSNRNVTAGSNNYGTIPPAPLGTIMASLLLTKYNNLIYVKRIDGIDDRFNMWGYNEAKGMWGGGGGGGSSYKTSALAFEGTSTWRDYFTDIPTSTKNPEQAGEMYAKGQDVTVKWDMNGELDEELTDKYKIQVYGRM